MTAFPEEDEAEGGAYASPPCFMHDLDPAGRVVEADARQWRDVMRWRKAARERLIGERLALAADERRALAERIAAGLDAALGDAAGLTVGVYWPLRGEPDLRGWMAGLVARGVGCALPAVVARGAPLAFRPWRPGVPLERDATNIPAPAEGGEANPDILIAPVVGFDPECWRLGYGGGYYDRTLAAMATRPFVVGVGYARAAIPTIYPQPHDIPMDLIVTEDGTAARRAAEPRLPGLWT